MVMSLRKRRYPISVVIESESESEKESESPASRKPNLKKRRDESEEGSESEKENNGYQNVREQRIRENRERMEKLGIFSLTSQLFNNNNNNNSNNNNRMKNKKRHPPLPKRKRYPPIAPRPRSHDSTRRSSRVKCLKSEGSLEAMGISIPDEWMSEIYTHDHEKLLGDSHAPWTLNLDGFSEDGERLYNFDGTPCHQCRQKILGKLTNCGKCRSPHGQLCGDCLYTRYGENVLEAVQNPTWLCPVCRGICNCSRCRRTKGWQPVNIPYQKVFESGFKSVSHYLILTRRAGTTPKELNDGIVTVDLTTVETTAPQHYEGSDYSAESSESDSDDSDSEDDSKGEKNKGQFVEKQVGFVDGSNEAAVAEMNQVR